MKNFLYLRLSSTFRFILPEEKSQKIVFPVDSKSSLCFLEIPEAQQQPNRVSLVLEAHGRSSFSRKIGSFHVQLLFVSIRVIFSLILTSCCLSSSVIESLTCPVCFDMMESPIYQCRNGHTLCNVCYKQVSDCPECRIRLDKHDPIRTLALERLIEQNHIKYPCKNQDAGCKGKLAPGETRKKHHKDCGFRSVKCFISGCAKTVKLGDLMHHMRQEHEEDIGSGWGGGPYSAAYTVSKHNELTSAAWKPVCFGDNLVCFAASTSSPAIFYLYCRHIETQVKYSISVQAYGSSRSYGGWSRRIDYDESDEIVQEQRLVIPGNGLWYLTNGDQDLDLTFTITVEN